MSHVLEIRRAEQLDSYRLAWNLLEAQAEDSSFYRSWDWMRWWLRRHRTSAQPRVLLVSVGADLVGILPLVQIVRRTVFGRLCTLGYPVDSCMTDCGPVGPNPTATMMTAVRYLATCPNPWHLLQLREYGTVRPLRRLASNSLRLARLTASIQQHPGPRRVELADLAKHTQSFGVGNDGETRFTRFRPASASEGAGMVAPGCLDACRQILHSPGESAAHRAIECEARQKWFESLINVAASRGALDIGLLTECDRPVALAANIHGGGVLHYLASSVAGDNPQRNDERERRLWALIVEDSLRRGEQAMVFPQATAPGFLGAIERDESPRLEIAQVKRGWQSQLLMRGARDRSYSLAEQVG
ncbi:MAG: hypothetical protein KDA42_03680 [Planctomycetales bacterium]|nr:hypothetical protein [Planctomycetales bacterium]